eukprot:SAG31_NODE_1055_length_10134_cov_14.461837_10_plen_174_part_00
MVEKEFDLGRTLGEGNYAEVKLCTEKATGGKWACKIINKKKLEPGDEEMLELETRVLAMLKHPNVVRLKKKFDTKKKMYLILELCTGGELLEALMNNGAYSEHDACELFTKVMDAVNVRSLLHRSCHVATQKHIVAATWLPRGTQKRTVGHVRDRCCCRFCCICDCSISISRT